MLDYIQNGKAHGSVASRFLANGGDPNAFRPYVDKQGRSRILVRNASGKIEGVLASNADATLRHEEWLSIDQTVLQVARERLKAVEDLRSRGLVHNIPQGLGKTVLFTEKSSDTNDAVLSMDGLRESQNDRQVFEDDFLPLPIAHKDFHFSSRQLLTSRNSGESLDTSMVAESTRKVAEMAEKLLIGSETFGSFGGGTISGYTNFSSALTESLSTPTGAATDGANLLADILSMRQSSMDANYFGPWMVYNSPAWDQFIDNDFKANSDKSIRQRIREVEGIEDVKTLDFMSNFDLIMVQMTSNVVREVVALDIQALQWETKGGMQINFKVMAILVPQLRADYNGNTGIVYGTA